LAVGTYGGRATAKVNQVCRSACNSAHNLAVYGRQRPAGTLVGMAVAARSMVRMGSPVRFRRGAHRGSDQRKRWCVAVRSRCSRPHPYWNGSEGQRTIRALIALLSSAFGHGVSDMARIWAGRMAETEHIPGLSAHESRTTLAAGGRVLCRPGPGFWWAVRLDHGGDRGVAWSLPGRL
jgi:hypothetical protein